MENNDIEKSLLNKKKEKNNNSLIVILVLNVGEKMSENRMLLF